MATDDVGRSSSPDRERQSSSVIKKKESKKSPSLDFRWAGKIILITLVTSFCLSYLSESVLQGMSYIMAVVILLVDIALGIFFDMLGTAVTTADVKVLNSMASRKVRGAKLALFFVSHAASVSNFCNDVIGDICGIISGSMCVVISSGISSSIGGKALTIITVGVTAVTAAATVGGKALGKNVAIKYNNKIVYNASRICSLFVRDKK